MRIKESTIRRILREEYRRVLTEADPAPPAPGAQPMQKSPTSDAGRPIAAAELQQIVNNFRSTSRGVQNTDADSLENYSAQSGRVVAGLQQVIGAINKTNATDVVARATPAIQNWNEVSASGNVGDLSKIVIQTLGSAEISKLAPDRQCLALIASLANKKPYTGSPTGRGQDRDFETDLGIPTGAYKQQVDAAVVALNASLLKKLVGEALAIANFDLMGIVARLKSTPTAAPAAAVGTPYTVVKGDTIAKILQNFYNIPMSNASNSLYEEFAANQNPKIEDITKIAVNQKLLLPPQIGKYKKVK